MGKSKETKAKLISEIEKLVDSTEKIGFLKDKTIDWLIDYRNMLKGHKDVFKVFDSFNNETFPGCSIHNYIKKIKPKLNIPLIQMQTNSKSLCNSSFITDISQLCEGCEIREKLNSCMTDIESAYQIFISINGKDRERVNKYLNDKIDKANQEMDELIQKSRQPGSFLKNVNYCFLSWKQSAIYFTEQLLSINIERNQDVPDKENETHFPEKEINLFCKSMPLALPKEHFGVFTRKLSVNNNLPFLTDLQFDNFILKAFMGNNTVPKQKFNMKPRGEKLLIQSVFYDFYSNYCMDYFSTSQCQDNFIRLLTENFEGWNFENVKNNFTPKIKRRL